MPYFCCKQINERIFFLVAFTLFFFLNPHSFYGQDYASSSENLNYLDADFTPDTENSEPVLNYSPKEIKLINFEPSVNDKTDLKNFSFHEKQYIVDFPIGQVWAAYENTKPTECWSGPSTSYLKSFLAPSFHTFKEQNHPIFKEGSVYLVRLKLIPLVKITVIFQLTKLDSSEKIIEMTYGMKNTSHGKQTIQFIADGNKTIIKHTAYFKSKSKFRDRYFYPKFHLKYIDEFHENIQKKLIDHSTNNTLVKQ